jgi:hypothetical protein
MSSAGIILCDNVLDGLSAKLFHSPNLYSCILLVVVAHLRMLVVVRVDAPSENKGAGSIPE